MVTIREVAKNAQTSIATVSRVLNDLGGYSDDTRKKVLQSAEELGYESNAIARSLIIKKTNTIGVVFPNISSMITHEFLNGIEELASKQGYSVIVSYTYSDPVRMMKALKTLNEKRVDGIIFTSDIVSDQYLAYLKKITIPVVFLSTKSEKETIPFVKVNDYKAAYDATNYLIECGHTEIGMISGNREDPVAGIPRVEGYKKALTDSGLRVEYRKIAYGFDFNFYDGKMQFKELIKHYPEMTAVFVSSDEMASGALTMAHSLNMSIPDDISIIGYDNTLLAQVAYPALTTLSQPLSLMGSEAVKMLLEQMDGNDSQVGKYVAHEVVVRDSVKKI